MKTIIDVALAPPEVRQDVIVLGVASADTHGPGVMGEGNGTPIEPGISNE